MSIAKTVLSKALKVKFNLTASEIKESTQLLISKLKETQDSIINVDSQNRTFKNTIQPLIDYDRRYDPLSESCTIPKYVTKSPEVRESSQEACVEISNAYIEMSTNEKLYKAIKSFDDARKSRDEKYDATTERYISKILEDFERSGIALPEEKRKTYEEKKKEIQKLTTEFRKNIDEANLKLYLTKDQLKGVPEENLKSFEKNEKNEYVVPCTSTNYTVLESYCDVEETRKQMYITYRLRGGAHNAEILKKIVDLRRDSAQLLGYPTYAHYAIENRMAHTPEAVDQFDQELYDKLYPAAQKEIQNLKEFKKTYLHSETFNAWDLLYVENQINIREHQLDSEKNRFYFPVSHIIQQTLQIAGDLFGYRFVKCDFDDKWDDSVIVYEVFNTNSSLYPSGTCNDPKDYPSPYDNLKGYVFFDLYPRESKYSHACCCCLQHPGYLDNNKLVASAMMICNFHPPAPGESTGYCTHDELTTFFHEFGHCLHCLSADIDIPSLSGYNTQDDFVEAPSQFFERFAWNPEVLKKITKHKDTNEPLPDTIINKIIETKNFDRGISLLKQVLYSTFDYNIHTKDIDDLNNYYLDMEEKLHYYPRVDNTYFVSGFGHLASSNYAAGYYGYNWADVYSADFYQKFVQEGIFNKELGEKMRKCVLSKGDSKPASELAQDFLGRKVDIDNFLKDNGIIN